MAEDPDLSVNDFQLGLDLVEKKIITTNQLSTEIALMKNTTSLKEHLTLRNIISQADADRFALAETKFGPDETLLLSTMSDEVSGFDTKRLETIQLEMKADTGDDRFEFIKVLGKGGMGEVVEVHDEILQRTVALKRVRIDKMETENEKKLLIEAQITGMLEHPSIVPVYDLRNDKNGKPFYLMRIVEEKSLKGILDDMRLGLESKYSLTQLISILRQVALAIQYAHNAGVIHRDLKPDNILIGKYGEVYIIDWGVALILENGSAKETPTKKSIIGTPTYLSPEQARGNSDQADFRTDVYALGALLYEILCLQPPFRRESLYTLLYDIVFKTPTLPSKIRPKWVPEDLEQVAMRALKKEPNQRFQLAEEFAEELEFFLEGVKEKEKKRKQAKLAIRNGLELESTYRKSILEKTGLLTTIMRLKNERNTTESYWNKIDRVEYLENEIQRLFNATVQQYSQAIVEIPNHEVAIEKLGALYWERFRDNERKGDRSNAAFFESLVRQYNDGRYDELLEGLGRVILVGEFSSYDIKVSKYLQKNGVLRPEETIKLNTPEFSLLHGSYLLEISGFGNHICIPFVLDRREVYEIRIPDLEAINLPKDFIYIDSGDFLIWSGKEERASTKAFAIQKYPTTVAQYLEFINDTDDPVPYLPNAKDADYFVLTDQTYHLPTSDRQGDRWDLQWPIISINYHDAQAYCEWKSQKEGRNYELPSLTQWMKAARGADGRVFPWGRHFNAGFCQMRDTQIDGRTPSVVGTRSVDKSPYGVFDMCGNVVEWTTTLESGGQRQLLGGASYNSFEELCELNFVFSSAESFKFGHYGFRPVLKL